jgi:hypothetical protein
MANLNVDKNAHVVDVLGNTVGRDQPIMLLSKASELIGMVSEDDFLNDKVIFFDPFCKAGEILFACAMFSCWHKVKGNKAKLDINSIKDELYKSNRYFGLCPDERHHKLSLRTFLGNSNSHDDEYMHMIRDGHYLSEIDGCLEKPNYEMEFKKMFEYIQVHTKAEKIIAVGNPPYQELDGGSGASAKPIYNYFIESLINAGKIDEFILVVPSRWFSAGKGLDNFRKNMMNCKQIKTIKYFQHAEEVFPTVQIKGGVCFLHWQFKYYGDTKLIMGVEENTVNLSELDIIPDDFRATGIVKKILNSPRFSGAVSSTAWSRKPFGFPTDYFKKNEIPLQESKTLIYNVACYVTGRNIYYIEKSTILKNRDAIDKYKVVIPRAYGKGMSRCTLPKGQIFILGVSEVCIETYNVVGCFNSKKEAESFRKYLQTDFARYLLGLRKITQDIPKDRWGWVPLMDNDEVWDDIKLARYFNLTNDELEHIRKKVEEWT